MKADIAPLTEPVHDLLGERLPRGVGWVHTLGAVLLALAATQVVTGLLMALYYAPTTASAWDSVRYLETRVPAGRFVRGLHHHGASAFVVLVGMHLLAVFWAGAYKRPRRVLWFTGLALGGVALAFGFTGYLLPWDLRAYFGTQVGTAIAGQAPRVGPALQRLLRGGTEVGQLTLARFYALHAIWLPLMMIGLTAAHLTLVRRLGVTPPGRRVGEGEAQTERDGLPFAPGQLARDSLVAALVVGAVGLQAWCWPPELLARADPSDVSYVPRPEWYFLGLQHLLRLFPGRLQVLGTVVLPGLVMVALLAVPFVDRGPERAIRHRRWVVGTGLVVLLALVGLTVAGWSAVHTEQAALDERLATPDPTPAPVLTEPAPNPAQVETGKTLFEEMSCGGCHPEADPRPSNFASPLVFQGDRAWLRWTREYLRKPHRIAFTEDGRRPSARMPDFGLTGVEARALAHYLASRRDPGRFPPRFDPTRMTPERIERGRVLFGKRKCINCHRLDPEADGGRKGPDLDEVATRLKPDFVWAIIENPYKVNPESEMKNLGLKPEEIEALTAFLMNLRDRGPSR